MFPPFTHTLSHACMHGEPTPIRAPIKKEKKQYIYIYLYSIFYIVHARTSAWTGIFISTSTYHAHAPTYMYMNIEIITCPHLLTGHEK